MSKFVVLLNGELTITDRLKGQIAGANVIAVDAGMGFARQLGVTPQCWIGDFDSSNNELLEEWRDVKRLQHRVDKDKTDGALALDYAIEHGADEIILVAGLGGQTDHVICHIGQLVSLAEKNVQCFATSGTEEAWPLVAGPLVAEPLAAKQFVWDFSPGAILSIVGLSDLKGLTLSGVKWPLDNADIPLGSSQTMSNEVVGPVSGSLVSGYGATIVNDVG